jgi:hypothetical protein
MRGCDKRVLKDRLEDVLSLTLQYRGKSLPSVYPGSKCAPIEDVTGRVHELLHLQKNVAMSFMRDTVPGRLASATGNQPVLKQLYPQISYPNYPADNTTA